MDKRPYSAVEESSDYSGNNSYSYSGSSRNDSSWGGYSRSDSYNRSGGGYNRSDGYDKSSGGYSRSDGYGRNDNFRGRGGGYASRGRGGNGGNRYQSGGYGQQNADNWQCSSCRFSNFGNRSSCYKCHTPKGDDTHEPRPKWGKSDDSSWSKPSWKDGSSRWGNSDGKSNSHSRDAGGHSWKDDDSWRNKDKKDSSNSGNKDELINWDDVQKNNEQYAKDRWGHLPEIVKNLYIEDPAVAGMTPEQVKDFREKNFGIEVKSSNPVPNPVQTFEQAFGTYPMIMAQIKRQGFEVPSPVQSQGWPILMQGIDMIGTAQTGTGKTLAFLLPALLHIVAQPTPRWERIGPTCLVLAPTRELAQQIEREVNKFEYENIRCVCIYGQGDKRNQIQKLNAMSEIVIATPGRLNDFADQGIVDLSGVSYLVLDEADRMLDMGFEPQVRKIVMHIRPDRQTILTSATWPKEVRALSSKLMKNPIHVIVGSLDLQAVDTITQNVIICSAEEKKDKLLDFLRKMKQGEKAIVFVGQKVTVDFLSTEIFEAGISVESMHGGRNQFDREYALRQLKTGRSKVLIATDVAARGIDIQDITHVFNYDCPKDMEEYVHRVGRTGRAGRSGESCTLMCREDWKVAGKLIDVLEKSDQKIPEELHNMKRRWQRAQAEKGSSGYRRNGSYGGGAMRNGWYAP
ncbi:putative ATP-dependent RNA helicase ddx43 [Halocaridina rubra]|uniref:RNA helicase n=1 Tax=Halocaridina rubra TaxID=373956 RepID=A0AAN8XGY5_HALRR